jgi:hypothetical protein
MVHLLLQDQAEWKNQKRKIGVMRSALGRSWRFWQAQNAGSS